MTRSLLTLFADIFAPFVSAYRDEFAPRVPKAASPVPAADQNGTSGGDVTPKAQDSQGDVTADQPGTEVALAPTACGELPTAVPFGWATLDLPEPVAVPVAKAARKPRAKRKAK